jgi:mediator of RNA polymerase II transcription subunit 17
VILVSYSILGSQELQQQNNRTYLRPRDYKLNASILATMTDTDIQLSLSSLPFPSDAPGLKEERSLDRVLHQIGRERGSFRNFNEASLQAELDDPEHKIISLLEDEGLSQKTELPADVNQAVQLKEALTRVLGTALNESALALDFISLLLSGTDAHAESSMSPALKQTVPVGSLAYHQYMREEDANAIANEAGEVQKAALGLVSQSLTSTSEALNNASESADKDRELDAIFWQDVRALQQAGWHVFKPKTGASATVSVRFGPHSSHVISLNRSTAGTIDTSTLESRDLSICTRIRKGQNVLAVASDATKDKEQAFADLTLSEKLTRARQSIFAEGLFSELVRECSSQSNLAAQVERSLIRFNLASELSVDLEIELSEDLRAKDESQEDVIMDRDDASAGYESVAQTVHVLLRQLYADKQANPDAASTPILASILASITHSQHRTVFLRALESRVAKLSRYSWDVMPQLITLDKDDAQQQTRSVNTAEPLRLQEQHSSIRFKFLALQCDIVIGSGLTVGKTTADPVYQLTIHEGDPSEGPVCQYASNVCQESLEVLDNEIRESIVAWLAKDEQGDIVRVAEYAVIHQPSQRVYSVSIDADGDLMFDLEGQEGNKVSVDRGYSSIKALIRQEQEATQDG